MKYLGHVWRRIGERALLGLVEEEAVVATGLEEEEVADPAAMVVEAAGVALVWVELVLALLALYHLWPQALALHLLLHLEPLAGPVVQSPFASEIAPVRMQQPKSE
jgi:hypothetical protein